MSSVKPQQPHVVLLPFPTQGHVMALMRLANLLHQRGFYITFLNSEFNHKRLIQSKGPDSVKGLPDFRFETFPDGLPPSSDASSQDLAPLCDSTRKNCLGPLKVLLSRLNSTPGVPSISSIVIDGLMTFGIRAARELGIPDVVFWTASTCSFIAFLHFRELVTRGICPFQNDDYLTDGTLNTTVDWMTGLVDVCMKDLPSFLRTTDPNDILFDFLSEESQNCLQASAIIFNTFHEFDKECLDALVSKFNFPNIYTIGPLPLLCKPSSSSSSSRSDPESSLWKPDSKVFEWLDSRQAESVVYVNYGSLATITNQQLEEFGWGLAKSKQPFLWIVRPDLVKGESKMFLEEFVEETKERGFVGSWCAQDEVLLHKAVGAFLTHCGWNSMMESVGSGVPLICWPYFGDQQTNCHYACKVWGIGLEISSDVKCDEVAEAVREVMMEGGEKGKQVKRNAQMWKRIAEEATSFGGSSYVQFDKLVKEALHFKD